MLNCRPKIIVYVSCIKTYSIFEIVYVLIYTIQYTGYTKFSSIVFRTLILYTTNTSIQCDAGPVFLIK